VPTVKQEPWLAGKPNKPGWYLLDLGVTFLDSRLGYQHHVVSVRMEEGVFRSSWDGTVVHPKQIDHHMPIPEPPTKVPRLTA
jgi:hypothetical protein